jgi:hypothetical protein
MVRQVRERLGIRIISRGRRLKRVQRNNINRSPSSAWNHANDQGKSEKGLYTMCFVLFLRQIKNPTNRSLPGCAGCSKCQLGRCYMEGPGTCWTHIFSIPRSSLRQSCKSIHRTCDNCHAIYFDFEGNSLPPTI